MTTYVEQAYDCLDEHVTRWRRLPPEKWRDDTEPAPPEELTPENPRGQLTDRRGLLVSYLLDRVREEDWHGVMDAAADIREVEAKIELIDWVMAT